MVDARARERPVPCYRARTGFPDAGARLGRTVNYVWYVRLRVSRRALAKATASTSPLQLCRKRASRPGLYCVCLISSGGFAFCSTLHIYSSGGVSDAFTPCFDSIRKRVPPRAGAFSRTYVAPLPRARRETSRPNDAPPLRAGGAAGCTAYSPSMRTRISIPSSVRRRRRPLASPARGERDRPSVHPSECDSDCDLGVESPSGEGALSCRGRGHPLSGPPPDNLPPT